MLTQQEFELWCEHLKFPSAIQSLIARIRAAEPARRVKSRAGNVSGRYPSRKMGCTIQFESHRNELATILELEHDPTIREYYDQPPAIKLVTCHITCRVSNRHWRIHWQIIERTRLLYSIPLNIVL